MRVLRLLACLVPLACGTTRDDGAAKGRAVIHHPDGGAPELVVSGRRLALPEETASDVVTVDDEGQRFAVETRKGTRWVYANGHSLWLGPLTVAPAAAPRARDAGGVLFDLNPGRRAELLASARAKGGEAGVAKLLIATAGVEAPEWDATYATLTEPGSHQVRDGLAKLLEPGAPLLGLGRAARLVPLTDATKLEARIREVGRQDPGASAIMLRALTSLADVRAASAACAVLDPRPARQPRDGSPFPSAAPPERRLTLDEAALYALASAAERGRPVECWDKVTRALAESPCDPWLRCRGNQPLSSTDDSEQDEPLCTRAELATALAAEAIQPRQPDQRTPRPSLFAFAAVVFANKVPGSFALAHARRSYSIRQPEKPECAGKTGLALGLRCHCPPRELREFACRDPDTQAASFHCMFTVDDKLRQIRGSTGTEPP